MSMTNEQIEQEMTHLATKADIANLRAEIHKDLGDFRVDFERSLRTQFYWLIGIIIAVQIPTWTGMYLLLKKTP